MSENDEAVTETDSPYIQRLDSLISMAEDAADAETALQRVKIENTVVSNACEAVQELSQQGDLSETQMNGMADSLSRLLEQYNKTDLKTEFGEYFGERRGTPFDEIIQNRLETVKIVASTDAKQESVFRWHFSDGVQIETETSDEGQRLHYSWNHFRDLYFDALLATGKGERIADPSHELRDGEEWREWITEVILDHSETVEHVGPRTEAVRQLRDYIARSVAYTDLETVNERSGIGIAVDEGSQDVSDLDADTQVFIPQKQITRVCEQTGISSRALQIELNARNLTSNEIAGVSDTAYVDGRRFSYWAVTTQLEAPQEIIDNPETPAEQVQREEEERREEQATDVGAVGSEDDTDGPEDRSDGDDGDAASPAISDGGDPPDPGDSDDAAESTSSDQPSSNDVGIQSSFGTDPDGDSE